MEGSHYFLKTLGVESYITHDSMTRVDVENFGIDSKIKQENLTKQAAISDEVTPVTANVQADDFFSSLELQSSSKTSSNMISLNFSNKLTGGIVTRSRSSFSSTFHDATKLSETFAFKSKAKGRPKKDLKRKKNEKLCLKRRIKGKRKNRKLQGSKKLSDGKDKTPMLGDAKKQNSNKMEENFMEKSLGFEKSKDDDDWILFNNLTSKKEIDDKMFDNKQILSSDLQNPAKRCTPELFSMNSILMSDAMSEGKDEVDNLLEVEDYDDSFLEEMEDFNYAPPRSHTGGKWKPGSLTVRTSPMLWQNQNWDTFLDDKHQDEEKRNRVETPIDSPVDSNKFLVSGKTFVPPNTYTGGKWKPITPPATHTGGKWKPSDFMSRSKKPDQDLMYPVESDNNWKFENEREMEPPPTHTGGKWKPSSSHSAELWKAESPKNELEVPTSGLTPGKWGSDSGKNAVNKSTLDVLASCQSSSGKCLKTSGGLIQYYCSPCNRRLSSKKMYKKHIQSELHFKRVLQENELEFDSRSLKLFHGLFTQAGYKERGLGKRVIKKPEIFNNSESGSLKREKKIPTLVKIRGKRVARREIIRCEVCKVKIPSHQLGKHLVSYYHSRRIQLNDPEQRKLILDNIHVIVKQAPYQCGTCKFYCNTHTLFKKHWALPVHKEMEKNKNHRFWCALCSFECEASRSMELHLDSNSHREVILAVNKSIPIIIRHKVIFDCGICFKEFRFNRELIRHKKIFHGINNDKTNKLFCSLCRHGCKNIKSLQRHILNLHKNEKLPYSCSICSEFFNTAAEAKAHRNSQFHKYKKLIAEGENPEKTTLTRSCHYCEKTLENIKNLKTHLLESHSELLPKCIKCGMVFALSQEVSQHVKNNECNFSQKNQQISPPDYACQICPFSTNIKSEFLLHSAVHQKKSLCEKKISCPLCGSLFTQNSLSIHLRTHLKEKTYQCSVCFKGFVRKDRYVRHLKVKHGDSYNTESLGGCSAKTKESKGEGDELNKEKAEKGLAVVEHKAKVEDKSEKRILERRQICGDAKCKYVAKDLTDLENHSIFHIGPKIYQCPECPYSAKTNTIIKRHYMIHIDERSFPCNLCSFKARLKSHLKRHMRLHTGAKPYKCPHCSYTCNILENLRKHVLNTRIHPGKKLYECKLCSFATNVSRDFKMHLFKSHKDEYSPSEANEAAGIYSKEEDSQNSTNSLPVKPRISVVKNSKKVYSTTLKKKVDLLTQKFNPIAPKPFLANYSQPVVINSKNTGNSVEDKRKILKMELEKLKNQIKPVPKLPRSYPSPADKEPKMNLHGHLQNEFTSKKALRKKTVDCNLSPGNLPDVENGVLLVNVMPTVISLSEELHSTTTKTDNTLQQTELSSACVLYENVLPSEEMELYLF